MIKGGGRHNLYSRDGAWYFDGSVNGRRVRRSLDTKLLRVAKERRDAILSNTVKAKWGTGVVDVPVEDFWKSYFRFQKRHHAENSWKRNKSFWDSFIECLEPKTLGSVTRADVERYKDFLIDDRGNAHRTVNDNLTRLGTAYRWAKKHMGYTGENPFEDFTRLPVDRKLPKYLSKDEIGKLLLAAYLSGDDIFLFCCLAVFAGLRTNEAGNSRWDWVNWKQGSITVKPGDGFSTKNREARTVPLHEDLRIILERYRRNDGFIILPDKLERGKWRVRYEPRTAFSTAKKAAGVSWASPHTLRHTFASHLVSNGVSLYKVSTWLGHGNLSTTKIYAHLSPADDDINRL